MCREKTVAELRKQTPLDSTSFQSNDGKKSFRKEQEDKKNNVCPHCVLFLVVVRLIGYCLSVLYLFIKPYIFFCRDKRQQKSQKTSAVAR